MSKSILDPTFRYVPAANTDIRETFKRLRREQEEAAAAAHAKSRGIVRPPGAIVAPLKSVKGSK